MRSEKQVENKTVKIELEHNEVRVIFDVGESPAPFQKILRTVKRPGRR